MIMNAILRWTCIVTSAMVLLILIPGQLLDFYMIFRYVIGASALFVAFGFFKYKQPVLAIISVCIAIFAPLTFNYGYGILINLFVSALFFIAALSVKKNQ